jgi:crossover junction endodeoxyribonuclease RuvC
MIDLHTRTWIGIDPGLTGAVAFLCSDGTYNVADIPVIDTSAKGKVRSMINARALANLIIDLDQSDFSRTTVMLEQTAAMPGQGVSSMFSMGDSFGACRGVIATLGLSFELVRPAKWKKTMGLTDEKGMARAKAVQMFPNVGHLLSRVKDHNRAEALLLAEYGCRQHQ